MAIGFYADHHIPRAITIGLRSRGVRIITANEDGMAEANDSDLLDRSTALGLVLLTFDDDHLAEAHRRQRAGIEFGGLIHAGPTHISIGECVRDLEIIAKVGQAEEVVNSVIYLPL